jgi:hypothetical protein
MDILKLSFPVTSPAMFRRFGFKWAEGVPNVVGETVWGYGSHIGKDKVLKLLSSNGYKVDQSYCISVNDCEEANFDPLEVAKSLGIVL